MKIGAVSKPGRVGVVGLSSDGVGGCHFLRTLPRPSAFPETTCISLHNALFGAVGSVCEQVGDGKQGFDFFGLKTNNVRERG